MIRAILLGAVIVHLVVLLIAFVEGMMFGAKDLWFPNRGPTGWQGGFDSMANVFFGYVYTMGIVPLIISAIGAVLGAVVCLLVRLIRNRVNSNGGKNDQPGHVPD